MEKIPRMVTVKAKMAKARMVKIPRVVMVKARTAKAGKAKIAKVATPSLARIVRMEAPSPAPPVRKPKMPRSKFRKASTSSRKQKRRLPRMTRRAHLKISPRPWTSSSKPRKSWKTF
ncbi:MAG: hypothetical protein ACO3F3_00660 [Gemmataceae bacterium]